MNEICWMNGRMGIGLEEKIGDERNWIVKLIELIKGLSKGLECKLEVNEGNSVDNKFRWKIKELREGCIGKKGIVNSIDKVGIGIDRLGIGIKLSEEIDRMIDVGERIWKELSIEGREEKKVDELKIMRIEGIDKLKEERIEMIGKKRIEERIERIDEIGSEVEMWGKCNVDKRDIV